MIALHALLVFLHVLSISVWIAAALWVTGDVRRTLALGRPHVDVLPTRVRPAFGLDAVAGLATLLTGGLLLWEGGLSHPPAGISAGIVLTFLRLGLLAGVRRAWRRILARLQASEPVPATDPLARRMAMLAGMAHAAWFLALAGMIFRL